MLRNTKPSPRNSTDSLVITIKFFNGTSHFDKDPFYKAQLTGWRIPCLSSPQKFAKSKVVYDPRNRENFTMRFQIMDSHFNVIQSSSVGILGKKWMYLPGDGFKFTNVEIDMFNSSNMAKSIRYYNSLNSNHLNLMHLWTRKGQCLIDNKMSQLTEFMFQDYPIDSVFKTIYFYGNSGQIAISERGEPNRAEDCMNQTTPKP
ncbi:hypothetical protein RF11_01453 [Thelohanellus kitauei]|uniref:Uncharacterized protein n=1 Tax=Thelohanellus kitauei TaxID=669202 RepID=A0A0C2M940_THEKT|nr:hypothetical protein RF11_01453 [Thelohanellus kitauei]